MLVANLDSSGCYSPIFVFAISLWSLHYHKLSKLNLSWANEENIYDEMKDTVTSHSMWQIHWKMLKIEGDNFPFWKTPWIYRHFMSVNSSFSFLSFSKFSNLVFILFWTSHVGLIFHATLFFLVMMAAGSLSIEFQLLRCR